MSVKTQIYSLLIVASRPFADPRKTFSRKGIEYKARRATVESGTVTTILTAGLHGF